MNKLLYIIAAAAGVLSKIQLNIGENATLMIVITIACLVIAIATDKQLKEWL